MTGFVVPSTRQVIDSVDTLLFSFRQTFTPKNLCDIPFIYKYVGHQAMVDIPAAGHNPDRAAAQQLLQPPLGHWAFEFAQFRCVDAPESDALTSHPKRIPIDRSYL
jgi:hypothetical protein